jgi:hypothetical protein
MLRLQNAAASLTVPVGPIVVYVLRTAVFSFWRCQGRVVPDVSNVLAPSSNGYKFIVGNYSPRDTASYPRRLE